MTIKEARTEVGLTQKQIFEKLGIPVRTLQSWEEEVRKCPKWLEPWIVEKILSLKDCH